MPWYAAHVVLYFEFRQEPQEEYRLMENVYLIHAGTDDEAWARAEKRGRSVCERDDESLRVKGRPARLVFGGVRKLISCAVDPEKLISRPADPGKPCSFEVETLEDGVEATYSFLVVSNRQDLDALIKGEPVRVLYEE